MQLSVKDSENKNTLAETTFEVEKLNVTTEDTAEGRARAEDIRNTENWETPRQTECSAGAVFLQ